MIHRLADRGYFHFVIIVGANMPSPYPQLLYYQHTAPTPLTETEMKFVQEALAKDKNTT